MLCTLLTLAYITFVRYSYVSINVKVEEKDLSHKDREEGAKMKTWGNLGLMYLACCTNKKEGTSKTKSSMVMY